MSFYRYKNPESAPHGYPCKTVYKLINSSFLFEVHGDGAPTPRHPNNSRDIHSWFSAESNLSFLTFRKAVDSTNCLALDLAPVSAHSVALASCLCNSVVSQSLCILSLQYFCFCCIQAVSFAGFFIHAMCSVVVLSSLWVLILKIPIPSLLKIV